SNFTAKFHFKKTGSTDSGGFTTQGQLAGGEVIVVVPDVQVLKVAPVPNSNGGSDLSQKLLTLALLPQDAGKVLYAGAEGHVWFSLLPPGEQGQAQTPVTWTASFPSPSGRASATSSTCPREVKISGRRSSGPSSGPRTSAAIASPTWIRVLSCTAP